MWMLTSIFFCTLSLLVQDVTPALHGGSTRRTSKNKSLVRKKSGVSKSIKHKSASTSKSHKSATKSTKTNAKGRKQTSSDTLTLIARALYDPNPEPISQPITTDLNNDGITDLQDLQLAVTTYIADVGVEVADPLTPTYVEEFLNELYSLLEIPHNASSMQQVPVEELAKWTNTHKEYNPSIRTRKLSHEPPNTIPPFPFQPNQSQCGQQITGELTKGNGPNPPLPFSNTTIPTNQSPQLIDYIHAAILHHGLSHSELPNALQAYHHTLHAQGSPKHIDFPQAFQQDPLIFDAVTQLWATVIDQVPQLHEAYEPSYQFHSNIVRSLPSSTPNWQWALGESYIWSTGEVTYDADKCRLKVTMTIHVEGSVDGSHTPYREIFQTFVALGWAHPYTTRGVVTRLPPGYIDLQCCGNTECGVSQAFQCQCHSCTTSCPTRQLSGGQGSQSFSVELYKSHGTLDVYYQMYTQKDALEISYEGQTIFSTGGLVSGEATHLIEYGSESSVGTIVTVTLNAPEDGTLWIVNVSCPL